jgi:hypothetical protein
MKRFDIALTLLEKCLSFNKRFKLFVKGKLPNEYSWMRDRPDELNFFNQQIDRINNNNILRNAVQFDGWGQDMADWYSKVGYILSVSDFEGTHQAVAEGGASGSIPIILNWSGASEVYNSRWITDDVDINAKRIINFSNDHNAFMIESAFSKKFMRDKFDINIISGIYNDLIDNINK